MENKELAREILKIVGPRENVRQASHCMTRLRLQLEKQQVDQSALKELPGVMGVNVAGPELQIILGPGKAAQVTDAFQALLQAGPELAEERGTEVQRTGPQVFAGKVGDGKELHEVIRRQNATPGKLFLKRISGIFVPLIPGFIGCGLLTGILNMAKRLDPALAGHAFFQILGLAGSTVFWGMNLFVGWNAAKEFGGSPVLGGALGALISHPGLAGLTLYGQSLIPGRGGVVAVLLVAALGALLERKLRKVIPEALDLFLTPFLVLGIMAFATLFVFQPLGGWLAEGIGFAATGAVARGGALTGALLGGGFLPLVMLGIHQGLTPIHAQLISQYGYHPAAHPGHGRRGPGGSCTGRLSEDQGSPGEEGGGFGAACRAAGGGRTPDLRRDPAFGQAFPGGLHRGSCRGSGPGGFPGGSRSPRDFRPAPGT